MFFQGATEDIDRNQKSIVLNWLRQNVLALRRFIRPSSIDIARHIGLNNSEEEGSLYSRSILSVVRGEWEAILASNSAFR